jgi:dihydroorotate dehydrogenase
LRGLPGLDIMHGGRPIYPGVEVQGLGPICGPELNPVALGYTAMLSKTVDLPLISGGGVMTWEHVVERLMLGARAVGLCSAVYLKGLPAITECVQGLDKFLDQQGYADCNAIRGLGLKYFARHDQVVQHPLDTPDGTLGEERIGW